MDYQMLARHPVVYCCSRAQTGQCILINRQARMLAFMAIKKFLIICNCQAPVQKISKSSPNFQLCPSEKVQKPS